MSCFSHCSTTEGYLYLYDRETSGRALKIDAHRDDANTVAFTDDSSQVRSGFWPMVYRV